MPTLAQIPQHNFNFESIDPDFSGIVNSYHDYVNDVIRKDEINKTLFENLQSTIENVPIGDDSKEAKDLFTNISKKYGQRIHQLASEANGVNGYADLTKQLDSLKHDVLNDSGFAALRESSQYMQQMYTKVLGDDETVGVNEKGEKVTKKNPYADWSIQDRQKALAKMKNEGQYVTTTDPFGKSKVTFKPGGFELPQAIPNLDKYIRDNVGEVQKYEETSKGQLVGLGQGLETLQRQVVKGYDVNGLNNAIQRFLSNDEKYQNYIIAKTDLKYYNPDKINENGKKGDYNYSLKEQINKSKDNAIIELKERFKEPGSISKAYEQLDESNTLYDKDGNIVNNDFKGSKYTRMGLFNYTHNMPTKDINGILRPDVDNNDDKTLSNIGKALNDKNTQLYFDMIGNYNIEKDRKINQPLDNNEDKELGRRYAIAQETQKSISIPLLNNLDIYKNHISYLDGSIIDEEERKIKKLNEQKANAKFNIQFQYGNNVPISNINNDVNDYDTQRIQADNIKNKLAILVKNSNVGYNGTDDIHVWLKQHPNITSNNESINNRFIESVTASSKIHSIDDNINEVKETCKQVDLSKFNGGIQLALNHSRDEFAELYINAAKENRELAIKNNAMAGGNLTIPDLATKNDAYKEYNNRIIAASKIAQQNGINTVKVRGELIAEIHDPEANKIIQEGSFRALSGLAAAIVVPQDGSEPTTTNDKNIKSIFDKIPKTKNGGYNLNAVTFVPVVNMDGRTLVNAIIPGENPIKLDLSASDYDGSLHNVILKAIAKDVHYNKESMTPKELETKSRVFYSSIAPDLTGNLVVKDNENKDVTVETPSRYSDLNDDVDHLKVGQEPIQFKSEVGRTYYISRINGNGIDGTAIQVQVKNTKGGFDNISKDKDYKSFTGTYNDISIDAGRYGIEHKTLNSSNNFGSNYIYSKQDIQ